jgi:hypothetical protein
MQLGERKRNFALLPISPFAHTRPHLVSVNPPSGVSVVPVM